MSEFIAEILKIYTNEWGTFSIKRPHDTESLFWGSFRISYSYGELETDIPESIVNQTVSQAIAIGCWSNTDYRITIEDKILDDNLIKMINR